MLPLFQTHKHQINFVLIKGLENITEMDDFCWLW